MAAKKLKLAKALFEAHYHSEKTVEYPFHPDYQDTEGNLAPMTKIHFALRQGEMVKMCPNEDPRRILVIGTLFGNFVVFDRCSEAAAGAKSRPYEVFGIPPFPFPNVLPTMTIADLMGPLNYDELAFVLGATEIELSSPGNIGMRIRVLVEVLERAQRRRSEQMAISKLFERHYAAAKTFEYEAAYGTPEDGFAGLMAHDFGLKVGKAGRMYIGEPHNLRVLFVASPAGNLIAFDHRVGYNGDLDLHHGVVGCFPETSGIAAGDKTTFRPRSTSLWRIFGWRPGDDNYAHEIAKRRKEGERQAAKKKKKK